MKKGKEVWSKLAPILVAVAVCLCTVIGFGAKQYLQGGLMTAPVSSAVNGSGILYSVLEIEPGWDYLYDESANKNKIANALGVSVDKISFKYVSTAEFNGMNEDLVASYDIIVMGLNTGTMNTVKDAAGVRRTIFNDRSLDGYIYLAYGDLIKYDDRMSGMSVYDYVCIDDYVNGVGGKSVNYTPEGKSTKLKLDNTATATTTNWKGNWIIYNMNNSAVWTPAMQEYFTGQYYILKSIDNTSWGTDVKKYYNDPLGNARFSGNDITKKKMNELLDYVSTGRPVVLADALYTCVNDNATRAESNKSAYPTSNVYSFLKEVNGKENVIKYGNVSSNLKNAMHNPVLEIVSYTMKYQNSSGAWVAAPNIAYQNQLIADSCIIKNVDKFRYTVDFKATIGKSYYVKVIVDKDTDGRFDSVPTVDDFNEVFYAKILVADEAQEHVELDINLAENYNGMFGWQILVEELDASKNPIDRVSVDGDTVVKGQTKKCKVLQLLPNADGNLKMSTDGTFKTEMGNASTKIGYEITVDTMKVDDFEKWFKSNPYDGYKGANDYLNKYEYGMLVIGFIDGFNKEDISDDYGALSCVQDFIENGNSVLFSHDTMHFPVSGNMGISGKTSGKTLKLYLQEGWDERAGTIMALGMRDMFGMDRYSITTIPNYTDPTVLDSANIPKNKDGEYITETQGFTNMFLLWLNIHTTYKVDQRPDNEIHTLVFNKNITKTDRSYDYIKTKKVEEINEGQITMYPYDVTTSGFLDVNETHGQYYQLDMEDDDLVVWYTLAKDDRSKGDIYNDTRRDAANNYYIYSKGNITYTGAGHSDIGGTSEVRLFVNTVIRAVAAGNFVPEVECVNGFTTRNAGTYVVNPKPYDTEYLVQFRAYDEDLATVEVIKDSYPESEWNDHIGRFASGGVYWIDASGTPRVLKLYDRVKKENFLLNDITSEITIYNPLEKGKTMDEINADVYLKNMYDCYMSYKANKKIELKVEAEDYYGEKGSCIIQVIEQELFDLD